MITLNELLTIADAKIFQVDIPLTPRLRARITMNPHQTAELDDLTALYGNWPVFSAEPADQGRVLMIDLRKLDKGGDPA